jgi:Cyclin, N-terminal domain
MKPVNFTPTPVFMETQRNITKNMREILLDWMMEVCEEFMIKRDTMFISISFIDRYIAMADYEIHKTELQLIGISSLYLACKVEEVYIPRI